MSEDVYDLHRHLYDRKLLNLKSDPELFAICVDRTDVFNSFAYMRFCTDIYTTSHLWCGVGGYMYTTYTSALSC